MGKIEVLVIEDNGQDAETIEYMLSVAGGATFSFFHAEDLTDGVTLLKQRHFDVVLLELGLPDRNRIDPVVQLVKEFPAMPVIALAGVRDEGLGIKALQEGVQDYLIKGRMTRDLLVRSIRSSMERKRLSIENAGLFMERERLEAEVKQMANHDPLTGLPNKRLFMDRISLERDRAIRQRKKTGIFILDIDRFKEVNDALGRDAGDLLLKETALRLKSLVRKSDLVARFGRDQFSVLLPDIVRSEDIADIAHNILNAFRKPFLINSRELYSTASIGISIYPDDSPDLDTLLRYADTALRRAKELGRDNFQFSDPATNSKARERIKLQNQLRSSLDSGELVIHYQPLVDIATGRIVCAEALARWRHPEKGLLPSGSFIPAAEEMGLIGTIDEWVLRKVCTQAKAWLDAGLRPVCVTVNVSARQLHHPRLIETMSTILAETGLPPGCLYLEITEKTAMSDAGRTTERIRDLAAMGLHISLDNFGTGYSSLDQLERMPIERLKIDKSFISRIPADPDNRAIVRSATSLAHNMRMKVVAEGVETEDQLTFLRKTGCDEMQGYLFSKPLPAEEFEEMLAAG